MAFVNQNFIYFIIVMKTRLMSPKGYNVELPKVQLPICCPNYETTFQLADVPNCSFSFRKIFHTINEDIPLFHNCTSIIFCKLKVHFRNCRWTGPKCIARASSSMCVWKRRGKKESLKALNCVFHAKLTLLDRRTHNGECQTHFVVFLNPPEKNSYFLAFLTFRVMRFFLRSFF